MRPSKRRGRRSELSERGCDSAVVTDEELVKICKPQETLKLFMSRRCGPLLDGSYLGGVWLKLPLS